MNPPDLTDADKLKMKEMGEHMQYILKKYEGYGLVFKTIIYMEKNGQMTSQTHMELTKLFVQPPPLKMA